MHVLTEGGPGAATEFPSVSLCPITFKFFNLNSAAALSLLVLLGRSVAFALLGRHLGREVAG